MASQIVCVKCLFQMPPTALGLDEPTTFRTDNSFASTIINTCAPFGRNGWSIAAGYLGLFALLPFFGVFAILTGYMGLKSITKKNPRGKVRSWFGLLSGTTLTALYLILSFAIAGESPYLLIIYAICITGAVFAGVWLSKMRKNKGIIVAKR
jgi:hypothetical protein